MAKRRGRGWGGPHEAYGYDPAAPLPPEKARRCCRCKVPMPSVFDRSAPMCTRCADEMIRVRKDRQRERVRRSQDEWREAVLASGSREVE